MGTKVPPNSQHKYSNLAYQLLGEIVARVAGRPYPDYVRAAILEPLGISTSGFDPLPEDWAARRATGYAGRSFSDVLDRAAQAPQIWAEGGLWSCVDDMAKWISLQLREDGGPRKDAQVLSGSSLHEMHRPRYLMGDDWTEAWGIAWYAIRRQEVVWIQHAGGLHGFSSNVCFDPRHKVGAIALLNGIGDAAELSMQLAGIARDALRAVAAPVARPPAMSAAFGPLLGVYMNHEFGQLLRLEWRDGKLAVIDPDDATWRPTLTPTDDPNVFVVDPGCRESGEPAVFHRVSDGRVRSVLLATTTWVRLDPVTSDQ
jgi:CubicO group peptidase (beta-lactamase class C family)